MVVGTPSKANKGPDHLISGLPGSLGYNIVLSDATLDNGFGKDGATGTSLLALSPGVGGVAVCFLVLPKVATHEYQALSENVSFRLEPGFIVIF